MKSKLAIAVTLWGWLLFVAWLSYDYVEYGNRLFIHIFQGPFSYEKTIFYVLIILVPFVYTVMGYMINERLKLLKQLEEVEKYRGLALIDEPTNLLDKRGFSILANQQLKIADRSEKGMLLFCVYVDNLEQINDTFGHSGGDMALIDAANIIKETFRKSDIIARIAGDKFAALAIEASWAVSDMLANRLKSNLESQNKKTTRPYKLSLSIGFSYYDPGNPCSLAELIARADTYMNEEKQGKQIKDILGID
jgi:diguanylate cyclase (GGDEF)-like protein